MGEQRNCIDCGQALVANVRGRPALRCGECARGRRRIKARETRVCIECGTKFQPPGHTGLPPQRCEPCRVERKKATDAAKSKRWREADPERQRAASRRSWVARKDLPEFRQARLDNELRRSYGLTRAELDALIAAQNNQCAICGGARNGPGTRLHVDHRHGSKEVRGLLCGKCNTAIGLLDDNPERAESAAAYLRR